MPPKGRAAYNKNPKIIALRKARAKRQDSFFDLRNFFGDAPKKGKKR